MLLTVAHDFLPKTNSTRASVVMDHFGIDFEQGRHVIAHELDLPVVAGDVVLLTGASGSGKSSLMRALEAALGQPSPEVTPSSASGDGGSQQRDHPQKSGERNPVVNPVLNLDDLVLPDRLLIDALPLPVEAAMNLLSSCGLGEAHLMLRTPAELSDGQRYRFRLALALSLNPQWVVADEFTATLDRTLAKVIAFNIRCLSQRTGTGFLLATTHEDVAADLAPNLHVRCRLDGVVTLTRDGKPIANQTRDAAAGDRATGDCHGGRSAPSSGRKKKVPTASPSPRPQDASNRSLLPTTSGFPMRPDATGRTLLAGITAVTTSDSSNS